MTDLNMLLSCFGEKMSGGRMRERERFTAAKLRDLEGTRHETWLKNRVPSCGRIPHAYNIFTTAEGADELV